MFDIFLFEAIGTGVFAGAADMIGSVAAFTSTSTLIFVSLIYFSMLLVCTPISGGHFNPAYTLSVFCLCNNKK